VILLTPLARKGRGFEGVVKRHRFAGGDSTHGAKGWHRRSGAIGQRLFPGTVMRGMKMPGHMGQVTRTTQNLEVIQVREAETCLLAHQRRDSRRGRRLRRHPRIQETSEGLETAGEHRADEEEGRREKKAEAKPPPRRPDSQEIIAMKIAIKNIEGKKTGRTGSKVRAD
jgi:hypothetical protein